MILPIVVVELQGSGADVDRDIAAANVVLGGECEVFVQVVEQLSANRPDLLTLTQEDCLAVDHVVSDEEDELYALGRGRGADVVCYYIQRSAAGSGILGCAAHPPGRRGFWVKGDTADEHRFVLAHEAGHAVGWNLHVIGNTDNLMTPFSPGTNPPPDLNAEQCARIADDPAMLSVESIVLHL